MQDNSINNIKTEIDERRRYDRARVIVDLFFDGGDATGVASTKDISTGGLYMNTTLNVPHGAKLLIRLPLDVEDQIVLKGEVVYSNAGRGVGVQFTDMDDATRAKLERLIRDS